MKTCFHYLIIFHVTFPIEKKFYSKIRLVQMGCRANVRQPIWHHSISPFATSFSFLADSTSFSASSSLNAIGTCVSTPRFHDRRHTQRDVFDAVLPRASSQTPAESSAHCGRYTRRCVLPTLQFRNTSPVFSEIISYALVFGPSPRSRPSPHRG